ncbi:MAG: phosphoribosylglycinamide formyltransferase [Bdellovibrio sp.]|nr:phosphoribosylglycinamide formyltransferase [Bdellovibrio sp.]
MIPVVVFASGRGSNFEAIHRAIETGRLSGVEIRSVLSDRPQSGVLARAKELGIPGVCVPFPEGPKETLEERRLVHARKVQDELKKFHPHFIILAGYMRIIPKILLDDFRSERGYCRIVNVHPSLLPAFPGVHSYAQAFEYGAKVSGVTVHLVEEGVDTGPICAQRSFSIEGCRTSEEVERIGLALEHELFPDTLNWVVREEFKTEQLPRGRLRVYQS